MKAVFFDLDGTLIDSEPLTGLAIPVLLAEHGIDAEVDCRPFRGVTWEHIEGPLIERFPQLEADLRAGRLRTLFHEQAEVQPPRPLPGAIRAVQAAGATARTAVVTSSARPWLELAMSLLGDDVRFDELICDGDYVKSKPDPECFLLAASRLGVEPGDCLVFEDSLVGLEAAAAAGMRSVAITRSAGDPARAAQLAHLVVQDYTHLPEGFFEEPERYLGMLPERSSILRS